MICANMKALMLNLWNIKTQPKT